MNLELIEWSGPEGLPRCDLISDADFAPAFDVALAQAEEAIEAIAVNPAAPDFANSVAALESAEQSLERLCALFYTLTSVDQNPEREALERALAPRLAAHAARVSMDPRLYSRVAAVWDQRDQLAPEDARLTEISLRNFTRAGAGLEGAARARMVEIRQRLAVLYTDFARNVLEDERDFTLTVPTARQGGLPDWLIEAMHAAAQERGLPGDVVTLSRSLIVPFLQYANDRDLREAAWRGWAARGSGAGVHGARSDNRALIAEILALRHERARLLGYEDFASYKLAPEMAQTADAVEELLLSVWKPAAKRASEDADELAQMMRDDGINAALAAWDWRYYAERKRARDHDFDASALKPYLTLDAMRDAVFDAAHRLFGLSFQRFDASLWHADVKAWRVTREDQQIAIFLADDFARPPKRSGAWCSTLRPQHAMGAGQRPIVLNVCNFTPPARRDAPCYLSWDDAVTLFHEFGHALHGMLSDQTWPSLSGLNVARDFVELPSQLFEHWLAQPALLDAHARHVETGEPLPAELRDRVIAAGQADAGFSTLEYLQSALVDLDFHRGAPPVDPIARQVELLAKLGAPEAIPMRHAAPHFAHVFAGDGYSAGYYSYLWSEVMDADAFAAFRESGDVFDPATAARLEKAILSRGNSAPAAQLWQEFRGRMPGIAPLLAGRGLA